jgi:hypothetical protein
MDFPSLSRRTNHGTYHSWLAIHTGDINLSTFRDTFAFCGHGKHEWCALAFLWSVVAYLPAKLTRNVVSRVMQTTRQ